MVTNNTSWTTDRRRYEEVVRGIAPAGRLVVKAGWIWGAVAWGLALLSLGRLSRHRFLTRFATTFGPLQAYPPGWPELSLALLAHEARHTRQFLFAGWFVPLWGWCGARCRVWAGVLPMSLIYGSFPLPVGLSWGRMRLELDADAFSWRCGLESGWMTPDEVRQRARSFAETVSGWSYLLAWPRAWTRRAFARRAEAEIERWQQSNAGSG